MTDPIKRYRITISINSFWEENFDDLDEAIERVEALKAKGPHSIYHTYYDIFDREKKENVYHFDFGNETAFMDYMKRRNAEEGNQRASIATERADEMIKILMDIIDCPDLTDAEKVEKYEDTIRGWYVNDRISKN